MSSVDVDHGYGTNGSRIERVSLIAPMYNEERHIAALVEDVAAQDFQGSIHLVVADGASTDRSVEVLREAARERGVALTVVENPGRWVSGGLNRCLRHADGDLVIRLDCHSRYPSDYVSRCVTASEETGAENVGGIFVARGRTATERAVAAAMDSPFGGVHWTRHGTEARVETDTVPYGAFRPRAFGLAGGFDESLVRNQDDEFNLRLRLAGGRVVLDPSIVVYYTPRGSYRRLFRQYYQYGLWKPVVMRRHGRVVSMRSLVPGIFVGSVALLSLLAPRVGPARRLLRAEVAAYGVAAGAAAAHAARGRGETLRLVPRVVLAFATFHVAYGTGLIRGLVREPASPQPVPAPRPGEAGP